MHPNGKFFFNKKSNFKKVFWKKVIEPKKLLENIFISTDYKDFQIKNKQYFIRPPTPQKHTHTQLVVLIAQRYLNKIDCTIDM